MNIQALANKTFISSSAVMDYKQLYEETKKNVAIFISRVDSQLSKILVNHQKQLQDLKQQNTMLREQIKVQNQSFMASSRWKNNLSIKEKKSASNFYSQEKIKDIYDCGLSQISLAESKSIVSERKKNSMISYVLGESEYLGQNKKSMVKSIITQKNKNTTIGSNDEDENAVCFSTKQLIETSFNQRCSGLKRVKKNNRVHHDDKQNVKDVLKQLRQKANTPISYQQIIKRQAEQRQQNIIIPGMFTNKR